MRRQETSGLRWSKENKQQKLYFCLLFGTMFLHSSHGSSYSSAPACWWREKTNYSIYLYSNGEDKRSYYVDGTCQLHQLLYVADHILKSKSCFYNPQLESDMEVTNGLNNCMKRLVPRKQKLNSLDIYWAAKLEKGKNPPGVQQLHKYLRKNRIVVSIPNRSVEQSTPKNATVG
ncbi:hypothetical protein CR513_10339, partial [Mucuna pruriens]